MAGRLLKLVKLLKYIRSKETSGCAPVAILAWVLTYSKGSKVATIAFSGGLNYRKKKSYFDLSWDDNNTYQGDTLSSTKTDVVFAWQRLLKNKWSTQVH